MLGGTELFLVEQIADKLISLLVDNMSVKLRESQVRREIRTEIEFSLRTAIENYPNSDYIFENFDAESYLNRINVNNQLNKLFRIWESPDENILFDEWIAHSGLQNPRNLKLILRQFILELKERLRVIPEIKEILQDKDIRESRAFTEKIYNSVIEIKQSLSSPNDFPISGTDNTGSNDLEIETRVDLLVNLYRDGNPNSSLKQLKEIEDLFTTRKISNKIMARVLSTIGGCLIALENEKDAIFYLDKAYHLDDENPDMMANYALARFIDGYHDEALKNAEKSLSIKPDQSLARIIRFEVLTNKKDTQSISELIEEEYLNDASYTRIIGLTFQKSGDLLSSEKYLRKSFEIDKKNIYTKLALAGVLIERELPQLSIGGIPLLSEVHYVKIKEALSLVEVALQEAQTKDNPILALNAKASRAGIRAFQGDIDGAIKDCEAVLNSNPDNLLALHNRALLALNKRDFNNAIQLLNRLPSTYLIDHNLTLPLIIACIESEMYDKATQLINQVIPGVESKGYYDFIVMKAWILIKKYYFEEAKKIRKELLRVTTEKARALEAAGAISRLLKESLESIDNFTESYSLYDDQIDKQRIALTIAEAHLENHNYEEAISWFEKLPVHLLTSKSISHQYASAVFFSRNYGKAYEFVNTCFAKGSHYPELLELQAWLAEYRGNLQEALEIQSELVRIDPQRVKNVIEHVRLLFLADEKGKAFSELASVTSRLKEPWDLLQAAEIYSLLGKHKEALSLGYQARKKGIGIAEIHLAYINLFFRAEDKVDLNLDSVQINTAVLLSNKFEKRWIKIIDIDPISELDLEYSKDSNQGRILIGHRVGDVVEYQNSSLEKLSFNITEIQSIFVRAFQETLEEFSVRFPGNQSMQRMQVIDNDFTDLFQFIMHSDSQRDKIKDLYITGAMTIEQFANVIGKNQLLVFLSLQQGGDNKIIASLGTHEDQNLQLSTAAEANAITLNLSSLLTFHYLHLLDRLSNRFTSIFISQRLIDVFTQYLIELDFEKIKGRTTLSYSNGQFFHNEIPQEITIKTIYFLERALEFLKTKCKVIPILSENIHYLQTPEKPIFSIGDVNISLVLVAKQTQTPIFADDYRLRCVAANEFKVSGFWTQELLRDFQNKGLINLQEYANACAILADLNYYYVSLNPEIIEQILYEDKYQLTKRVDSMLRILKGPDTDENDAIRLVSGLLKKVWLARIPAEHRIFILDRILGYLTSNRIRDRVLRKLLRRLEAELAVAPLQYQNILQEITLWIQQHPTQGKLLMGRRIDGS
jgi:tetratricopeptide (TPR) repeat protein